MAVSLKHSFNNPKSDGPDSTVVRPSDWNAEHTLTLGSNRVLGRVSSGTGAVEELTGSQVRSIADVAQAGAFTGINTRTASYTLVLSDRGKLIEMNVSGANTVTVPNESGAGGVNFPIGTQIIALQLGDGATTLVPAAGVTVRALSGGLTTVNKYVAVTLYKRASNDWLAVDQSTAYLSSRLDALTNFQDVYQGAKSADPSERNNASALQTGDLYYNTVNNRMRVYEIGTGWIDYEATAQTAATTAAAQAASATTQAGVATSQASAATSQATAATNAKIAAEAAATASLASAAYTTTAAGLAATTTNQIFFLSTSNSQIFSIYRNNVGAAEFLGSLNVADGSLFPKEAPIDFAWSVVDGSGRAAIGVKDDGTFEAEAASISDLSIDTMNSIDAADLVLAASSTTAVTPPGYEWSLQDADGRAAIGVKDDGTFVSAVSEVDALTVTDINGIPADDIINGSIVALQSNSFVAEVNHIPTYGQSLSILGDTVTTTQPYDSVKFNIAQTAFVPLTAVVPPMGTGETPAPGTGHAIKQLIASENSILYTEQSYQLLFSVDGEGGTTATQLSKPSTPYSRLIASVQAGFNVSQGLGKSFNVPAITWTQGESDQSANTPADTYKSILTTFLNNFDVDAKAITSQSNDVKMIMYQTATHKYFSAAYPSIALAQLAHAKESPKVFMAAPMYQFDYTDNLHVDGASAKKLGFYYGLVYKRVIVDKLSWKPLMPISKYKQGSVAIVKFHVPYGKLVFDTTTVAANTNYGFNLFDSGGTELTISSVSITGPNTVKIVAASAIPAGAKLRYAFYGSGTAGRTNGPRGNLRDTQGTSIVFDPAGLNYPAHNWCVMFEEVF